MQGGQLGRGELSGHVAASRHLEGGGQRPVVRQSCPGVAFESQAKAAKRGKFKNRAGLKSSRLGLGHRVLSAAVNRSWDRLARTGGQFGGCSGEWMVSEGMLGSAKISKLLFLESLWAGFDPAIRRFESFHPSHYELIREY
jgi:hypothetical protein